MNRIKQPVRKVVVGMSGGVDSAAAAAILLEKGFEVIGATLRLRPGSNGNGGYNRNEEQEIEYARQTARELGIKHHLVDTRQLFREKIIEYFCEEYGRGRTPNPCIPCNRYIKFKVLLEKGKQWGADLAGTGHYARIDYDKNCGRYIIRKGVSAGNDQAYMLCALDQQQLARIIFPLGEMSKQQVRDYAAHKRLTACSRKDSQEICFIENKNHHSFLRKNITGRIKPGPIITVSGDSIGRHKGLPFYTIGQREGLGIGFKHPLYVIRIDTASNTLVVGAREETLSSGCTVEQINLILYEKLGDTVKAQVKIRYQHQPIDARVIPEGRDRCRILFDRPQMAVTPGQTAVFYDGDRVIGGGTITESINN